MSGRKRRFSVRSGIVLTASVLMLGGVAFFGYRLANEGSPEDRARAYYQRGETLARQHDYARASIELRNAVSLDRGMLPAWRSLAQIEEARRQWNGLTDSLRAVVALDPKDAEARLKLARLLVLNNADSDALALIDAAAAGGGQEGKLLGLKSVVLLKLNERDQAAQQANKALAADPGNVDALMALARIQAEKGDASGALQILDKDPAAIANIGVALLKVRLLDQLGQTGEEQSLLETLTKRHPEEATFRKQLIKLYVEAHHGDDAEAMARAAAKTNPANVDAGLEVVRVLYQTRGPEAAKQELVARIGAGGKVFPYEIALADLEAGQGHFDESKRQIDALIKRSTAPEEVSIAQLKLAEICVKAKEFDEADALLSKVLERDGRNAAALKLRSSVSMARGQFDLAVNDLKNLLSEQPRSPQVMLLLADAYEKSGSVELARQQHADAVRASDFDRSVGLSYASFLVRNGNVAYADSFLTELQGHWPKNPAILSALGGVKLQLQDLSGAESIARSMREAGDPHDLADQILGAALGGQKKTDDSIAAFQRAADAAPSEVRPMVLLVKALVGAGQNEKAIAFLNAKLQADPANVDARVLMGSAHVGAGAPDKAIEDFKLAIETQPKNALAYEALANLYSDQNKVEDAIEVLQSGLQANPDSPPLRLMLAGAFERNKQFDAAISQYEQCLKEHPDNVVAINNLAGLLADHRRDEASFQRAGSLAERLERLQAPQFKDTIGWVRYRLGDYRGAVSYLESAAAAAPDAPAILYHLGLSYLATEQKAQGLDELKMALSRTSDGAFQEEIREAIKKAVD
jgi:cellulose synthase operon protein C